MPEHTIKLFVYGTLRPKADRWGNPLKGLPATSATLPGWYLFDTGNGFPAAYVAMPDDDGLDLGDPIVGEVVDVPAAMLPRLDRIEGHPYFFHREPVTVQTEAGNVDAVIYAGPRSYPAYALNQIPTGDWLAYLEDARAR